MQFLFTNSINSLLVNGFLFSICSQCHIANDFVLCTNCIFHANIRRKKCREHNTYYDTLSTGSFIARYEDCVIERGVCVCVTVRNTCVTVRKRVNVDRMMIHCSSSYSQIACPIHHQLHIYYTYETRSKLAKEHKLVMW